VFGCSLAGFENEFVTNTMHGLEVNGVGRIRLEFVSQPANVVIDCAGARIVFEAPDMAQEFIPRDYPPRTGYQEPEEFEFQGGEENWPVRAPDFHA
jgi:hypothetical protein